MSTAWEGMLLVDKPAGPTSHDVVAAIRRATGQSRAGHTGTLDPPATGLLVLLLGAATRLAAYVPAAPKVYAGTFRLGVTTLTDDLSEPVTAQHQGPLPPDGCVREEAARFVGSGRQIPPSISARHVAGRRLYRAARKGVRIDAPDSAIHVERFDVEPGEDAGSWRFEASVSTGTYIRAIVRDLGAALGCGAAVASLRRTRIGPLDVGSAAGTIRLEELEAAMVPLDAIPLDLPSTVLSADHSRGFVHGRTADTDRPDGPVAVRDAEGALLGIGEAAARRLAPRVVLDRSTPAALVAGRRAAVITSARSSS